MADPLIWVRKPGQPPVTCYQSAIRFALSNGYEECSPPPAPQVVPTAPTGAEGAAKKGEQLSPPVAAKPSAYARSRRPGRAKKFTEELRRLLKFYREHPGSTVAQAVEALGTDPTWSELNTADLFANGYLELVEVAA
ncbi:MAG TPA: hypothetical protein PLB01_00285 [Thermoanaerobaculia bacterium]|nr:hypothetical protein [Thermoanaerobaculia bacterium]